MNVSPGYRRGLLAGAFSAGLLLAAATPAVAQEASASAADCDGPVAVAPSGARGYVDSRGVVREPVLRQTMKEVPARAQTRILARNGAFEAEVAVYWHIITNGADGAVSMGTIADQLDVLNDGFGGNLGGANAGFTFDLAAVDVTDNAAWYDAGPGSAEEAAMKQALKQGGPGDLNVYSTSGNAYLGWAYFPDIVGSGFDYLDGVVIDYRSMPGGPYGDHYSLGGTLTHEAGHWAGLYHTFGGNCGGKGDYVADTPTERTPTGGCPEGKDSCPKPGLDPIHNFMDYSYDSCYTEFTEDQATRMQVQFLFFRD
jgi:Pregnancy-associated plasma protein-A